MAYYPKNKVKTGLYTNGDEYIIQLTGEIYIGYYYKLANGKIYSGKNTNEPSSQLLIKLKGLEDNSTTNIDSYSLIALPQNDIWIEEEGNTTYNNMYSAEDIIQYTSLSKANINKKFKNPTPFYPQPTKDNYKLGEFQRYFCVKTNELKYIEITKEQCKKFKNKDKSVAWQYFIPFSLPWDISGEKEQVYQTNKNITLLTEKRIKRKGLQEFLKKNYLKFYEENNQPNTPSTPTPKPSGGTSSY